MSNTMSRDISNTMSREISSIMSGIMSGLMYALISPNTQNKYDTTKHKRIRKAKSLGYCREQCLF